MNYTTATLWFHWRAITPSAIIDSLSNKAIEKGKSQQMPIFFLFHTALECMQCHRCFWIYLVQKSVLPTALQWHTAQAWGRTVTLGLQLFLQPRLAVLDPQLICSFQSLFTGIIEYVWKIRIVVSRTSRGAFPACTHWLGLSLQFVGAFCHECRDWASWNWCEKERDGRDHNLVPCIASVLGVG